MQGVQIYKNLSRLNALGSDEAEAAFLACCGSREWARRMANACPFAMIENVFTEATRIWNSLSTLDRLEAFRLADANAAYSDKFGFGLVIFKNGKSGDELAAIARARLGNSTETELKLADAEQQKIIEARLAAMLEDTRQPA